MYKRLRALFCLGIEHLRRKTISDDYIDWLCFANAGMLQKGNFYSIDLAIQNLPSDKPILEIGSFCGLSTNLIAYLLSKHRKTNKMFSCDKWVFEGATSGSNLGNSNISRESYREFAKSTFIHNVEFFSQHNKPLAL